jgi:hypothetical protein
LKLAGLAGKWSLDRAPKGREALSALLLLFASTFLLAAVDATPAAAAPKCPNAVFRSGPSAKLPDCRAYELVSPRYTAGIPMTMGTIGILDVFNSEVVSSNGDSVVYNTIGGAFPGYPGTGNVDQYRSHRTSSGWVTEAHGPSGEQAEEANFGGTVGGGEYSYEQVNTISSRLTGALWAPWAGFSSGHFLRTPSGDEPLARGSLGDDPDGEPIQFFPHGSHILFESEKQLEPDAPQLAPAIFGNEIIYDRTPGGPTHVVSLLPGNVTPTRGMGFVGASPDGSDVAFTPEVRFFVSKGFGTLYVRRNNEETVEVLRASGVVPGSKLTCTGEPTSGPTIEYQWLRNAQPIPAATGPTYTTTAADEGTLIQCQVTATSGAGTTFSTSATRPVEPYVGKALPENEGTGYISPTNESPRVTFGQTMTCNSPQFNASPTLEYQWLRDGAPLPGATEKNYTPVESEIGHYFQCRVTATTADGKSVAYSYNTMTIIAPIPRATVNPSISNLTHPGSAPAVGDELSCAEGTWSIASTFEYQWLRDGAPIGGATTSSHTTVVADEGKGIQCAVTGVHLSASTTAVSDRLVAAGGPPGTPVHQFLESFGSAAQPAFGNPKGLAVDQTDGDLYVLDTSAGTVSRYKSDGTPDNFSSLGTNVIENVLGGASGANEVQVAVDESGGATDGDIYVTNESAHLVDIFSSAGSKLGTLTSSSEGTFGEVCGVAVDSAGAVYVGDYSGKIHKFVPSSNPPVNSDNSTNLGGLSSPCQLAAGAGPTSGYLFAASYGGELVKMDSSTGAVKYTIVTGVSTISVDPSSGYVYAIQSGGFQAFDASLAGSATVVSKATVNNPRGIAVRSSTGNVYVSQGGVNEHVSVYGPPTPGGPEPPELVFAGGVFNTAEVGSTLFCGAGTWTGEPTFTFQWLRNGAEIGGATESSYHVIGADVGSVVECRVEATNADGSTVAIDANEGAKYVPPSGPVQASARFPSTPGWTFNGIFNHHLFYSDKHTDFIYDHNTVPADIYDHDLNTGTTTRITDTGDAVVVNISRDASHVYFVSYSKYNNEGITGKPNLYVWSRADESIKYITTVTQADMTNYGRNGQAGLGTWAVSHFWSQTWGQGFGNDHTRTTPNGDVFAFETTAQLTSFDNVEAQPEDCAERQFGKEPCTEVYRYDTRTEELECISCPPGEGPATGEARLQSNGEGLNNGEAAGPSTQVESLTEDGSELFFETNAGLVRRDLNETYDVYRWKEGVGLSLISTGQSLAESHLYGVSGDGSNVVLTTRQQLVPEDENGSTVRLYDARVGGGFPPPEETVTEPCSNDACQGQPSAAPEEQQISSSSIKGAGDFTGKLKCAKGLRRVTKHGKEACVKRKRHHRKHHRRKGHTHGKGGR